MSKADTLILGNIVTMDPARSTYVQAMTVKDGKIQYLGNEEWARKLCGEGTQVLDYGSNYVFPGFMEAHCHGALAGPRLAFYADLKAGQSMPEYVDILKEYIAANPDNGFYYGAGWSERECQPTAAMLDAICPDKPIALNSIDGHSMWFNTAGMAKFGIDAAAAAEWGTSIIRLGEDGLPTGYISEGPVIDILKQMSVMAPDDLKKAFLTWQDFALKLGYTAYYEAGVNEICPQILTELIDEGKWKMHVYLGFLIDERAEDYVAEVRKVKQIAERYDCDLITVLGVKIFMDGVIEAHTGWMLEDYDDMPGYTGVKRMCDHDRVTELYKEANSLGLNVHSHCIGDGAAHFALDCIEAAQMQTGIMDARNAIAHLQQVSPEDVVRLGQLNAVAVVAPLWMCRTDPAFQKGIGYIGEKRSYYAYPQKSFQDNGAVLAFHSDFPVSSAISVPRTLYMACKRNNPGEEDFCQMNPNECLDRVSAIRGMTSNVAYSVKEEGRMGTLRIGACANASVFDINFLECSLEQIPTAKWVATVIDGMEAQRA